MKPVKFNPTNVNEFENVDIESTTFEKQEKYASEDLDRAQKREHRDRDMDMKEQWSRHLTIYLIFFTLLMYSTLFGGKMIFHLDDTTLNFLITFGFAKVIGAVWIIVRHLFPTTK